jgi:hypothetical protein
MLKRMLNGESMFCPSPMTSDSSDWCPRLQFHPRNRPRDSSLAQVAFFSCFMIPG